MHHFRISQFRIESEITLPAAPCCDGDDSGAPLAALRICCQPNAAREYSQARWVGVRGGGFLRSYDVGEGALICAADSFQMRVASSAETLALDFDETDDTEAKIARALSTNLGLSLCTLLRGEVPLHGAGVEVDGRFIGIMAPSGAGKSTMLWALLNEGALFGNDDVIPIQLSGGAVMAVPSVSLHAKLSREALEKRGENICEYSEWVPGSDEFWVPIEAERRVHKARPLAALFVLRPVVAETPFDEVRVARAGGGSAVSLLMENTQGLWAAAPLLDGKKLLASYAEIARCVPLYVLHYHRSFGALPVLLEMIRDLLRLEAAHA